MPIRAILLSAGEGSRLRPFTADKPKPMVRAANKPILEHAIEGLVASGVTDITVVAGYHREKVQSHFGDGRRFGATIRYAFQDNRTGTANALATAAPPTEPFLVLGGDNLIDHTLVQAALNAPGSGPAIVVHRSERPQRYGVVRLDGERVERIVEKPDQPESDWVNTGIYRLTPEFHERAKTHALGGIPDLLQETIHAGGRVVGVRNEGLWADAVYPWDLLHVNALALRHAALTTAIPGVTLERHVLVGEEAAIGERSVLGSGTCIGRNVEIGPGALIENSIIYDDVQIGAGAILRNTIVGEGTRIGPRFTAISGPATVRSPDGHHDLPEIGAMIGEDARIGGAVTVLPGTILGNRTRVSHGKTVSGPIEDGSLVL